MFLGVLMVDYQEGVAFANIVIMFGGMEYLTLDENVYRRAIAQIGSHLCKSIEISKIVKHTERQTYASWWILSHLSCRFSWHQEATQLSNGQSKFKNTFLT